MIVKPHHMYILVYILTIAVIVYFMYEIAFNDSEEILTSKAVKQTCNFDSNTVYDCSSVFDYKYYVKEQKLDSADPLIALKHWKKNGIPRGYRSHPGRRIIKMILMTKNEWPMLRSWVLYHGTLLGFENLYVLSSDTDERCIQFLEKAKSLGINYFKFSMGFDLAESKMQRLSESLRYSGDFITKFDTDEFLTYYNVATGEVDLKKFHEYVETIQYDGGIYQIPYEMLVAPTNSCTYEDNAATRFTSFQSNMFEIKAKAMFPLSTFDKIDLGNHVGRVKRPYKNIATKNTHLGYLHFHNQCHSRVVQNSLKALLSHGYINKDDNTSTVFEKLELCANAYFLGKCICTSCHKVLDYYQYLKDPRAHEIAFYNNIDLMHLYNYDKLSLHLLALEQVYSNLGY